MRCRGKAIIHHRASGVRKTYKYQAEIDDFKVRTAVSMKSRKFSLTSNFHVKLSFKSENLFSCETQYFFEKVAPKIGKKQQSPATFGAGAREIMKFH